MDGFSGSLMAQLALPKQGRSRRATSTFRQGADGNYDPKAPPKSDLEERSNRDNFRVQPGQTHVLMDVDGPGAITHMWLTFLGPEPHPWAPDGSANHQEMLLRIYWDGRQKPAVEAPVGDFFAGCFGKRSHVSSLAVAVEGGDSYNCFWHMPFRRHARIEIMNQSEKPISLLYYNIDWIELDEMAEETPYFHAQYRQAYPLAAGKPYLILETEGRGHYVGTVLAVRTRSPSWFGEGDEMITIDGEAVPSVWGTGTEDYFLCAWGLQKTSTPYFGVPYFDQWGIVGGHTSAYRWHLNDPIVFQKSIKVEIETFGWISPDENPDYKAMSWNPREDDYASVAFWYQTGESTFREQTPKDRRLPSLERATFLGKEHLGRHGAGQVQPQKLPELYEAEQMLYMPPSQENAWIEIPFTVTQKEPLRLLLNMTTSYDFGRYQASLDGVPLRGPLDFYTPEIESREFHLLDFWPEPGLYTLRLECVGKNHLSAGHYLGLESVRLRERRPRVLQMGHDREKDWRKDPKLYE